MTPEEIWAMYQQVQENFRKNAALSAKCVRHDRFWQAASNLRVGDQHTWKWITGGWSSWPPQVSGPFYAEIPNRRNP